MAIATTKDSPKSNRQQFCDLFQKTYSKDQGIVVAASVKEDIISIPTGILSFDTATGIGGFPRGRVVEVFGPESGGKSLLTLVSVAYLQDMDPKSTSLYFDIEGSTPREWLETLGIDLDRFDIVSAGMNAEQYLDSIVMAIKSEAYDYIIVDSVAGLICKAELEGLIVKSYMAELARAMSKGVKKIVSTLSTVPSSTAPCIIFINQIRERVGVMFGNPETTPGGKALKFYSAQRYRVTRKYKSEVTENGDIMGHSIVAKNNKNKLGPPKREGEFFIHYTKGVDISKSIMNMIKQRNLYTKVNQSYHLQLEEGTEPIVFDSVKDITAKIAEDKDFQTRVYNYLMQNYIGTVETTKETNEEDDDFDDFE